MYRLRIKRGFATILKNEKEIEPLSGLLVVGNKLAELQELVNLANEAAAQQMRAADACPKCGQVPNGQGGEYPCSVCGVPTLHDS